MKVVSHPFAGKILVAMRDLPKGYKVCVNLLLAVVALLGPRDYLKGACAALVRRVQIVYWGERKRTKDATEDR